MKQPTDQYLLCIQACITLNGTTWQKYISELQNNLELNDYGQHLFKVKKKNKLQVMLMAYLIFLPTKIYIALQHLSLIDPKIAYKILRFSGIRNQHF